MKLTKKVLDIDHEQIVVEYKLRDKNAVYIHGAGDAHRQRYYPIAEELLKQGIGVVLIANIIYNPWVQPYFRAGPLNLVDWLTALACAALYMGFRLLQRHTRQHTRRAVLKLHQEVRG